MTLRRILAASAIASTLVGSPPARGQDAAANEAIRKVDPSLVEQRPLDAFPGISSAFLQGAFDAPGLYAAYSFSKAGSFFPPHQHPDMRMTIVVSGTMYLAEGERPGEKDFVAYPAGTIAITPAGTMHAMAARSGDFAVLEIGHGPSGTEFAAE